jgi:hypothetical protein
VKEKTIWFDQYKGITFEINRFAGYEHNGQKFGWTYYLHLLKEQFPIELQDKVLTKVYYMQFGSRIETYEGFLHDLEWHGGMTWSSNETSHDEPFTRLKFGCDFQHLWDNNIEYSLEGVLREVKECIDSLLNKVPTLKTRDELYEEFRKVFPGEKAGDQRHFNIKGEPIEFNRYAD